jgi:prepilin-type N-terminal cleavage/methylation domain-containing protein
MFMHKGFTLLELLIVIGVLAILAAVVTVVLNPAELLKQARDSSRVSDLANLNSALGLYLTDVASPTLGVSANCYVHNTGVGANCGGRHSGTTLASTNRSVGGGGWIPVNFESISSGSPLPTLPVDPANSAAYFYSYALNNARSTYELNAVFESVKYRDSLGLDDKDGGNSATTYEIGSDPSLDL